MGYTHEQDQKILTSDLNYVVWELLHCFAEALTIG
jgi:hypothetical protein